jgi:uncharacterized MnhB-related membrane protein
MTILVTAGIFLAGALVGACLSTIFLTSLVPRGEFGQLDAQR